MVLASDFLVVFALCHIPENIGPLWWRSYVITTSSIGNPHSLHKHVFLKIAFAPIGLALEEIGKSKIISLSLSLSLAVNRP